MAVFCNTKLLSGKYDSCPYKTVTNKCTGCTAFLQGPLFYQFYHIISRFKRENFNCILGPYYQMSSSRRVHSATRINLKGIELSGATVFYAAGKYIYLVHNNLQLRVL